MLYIQWPRAASVLVFVTFLVSCQSPSAKSHHSYSQPDLFQKAVKPIIMRSVEVPDFGMMTISVETEGERNYGVSEVHADDTSIEIEYVASAILDEVHAVLKESAVSNRSVRDTVQRNIFKGDKRSITWLVVEAGQPTIQKDVPYFLVLVAKSRNKMQPCRYSTEIIIAEP